MIEVGDLRQFGFRIAPQSEHQLREVSIIVGGVELTRRDNTHYLPSFIRQLAATSDWLKRKIDYLKNDTFFRGLNVSQIHNLLLHGNPQVFHDDREWEAVASDHRFTDWDETPHGFVTFLIPHCDRLYMTYQFCDATSRFEVLDVVDGVETTPFYLIHTIDEAVSILQKPEPRPGD